MMQVWAAWRNADMIEGKGPMVMDKVFMDESDAQAYINQQEGVYGRKAEHGWQNSDMGDWQVQPFPIHESLHDSEEYQKQQTIKAALAKLSTAEKRALGLTR